MTIRLAVALLLFRMAIPGRSGILYYFRNGNELTADWVRVQDGKLLFKAEAVGELSVPLANVRSFSTTH
jgi:hypothetical protein